MKSTLWCIALSAGLSTSAFAADSCKFGPTVFGERYIELRAATEVAGRVRKITVKDAAKVEASPILMAQILTVSGASSVAKAFSGSDDGKISVLQLKAEGMPVAEYTLVQLYQGGTLVGGLFEKGSKNIVVGVEDGQLTYCDLEYAARPAAKFKSFYCANDNIYYAVVLEGTSIRLYRQANSDDVFEGEFDSNADGMDSFKLSMNDSEAYVDINDDIRQRGIGTMWIYGNNEDGKRFKEKYSCAAQKAKRKN